MQLESLRPFASIILISRLDGCRVTDILNSTSCRAEYIMTAISHAVNAKASRNTSNLHIMAQTNAGNKGIDR